jgi:hypothetical protein
VLHLNRGTTWIKTGKNFMARKYPKFLWANPTQTKSEGPFIVHTQEPRFIAKPIFDGKRRLRYTEVIEVWTENLDLDVVMDIQEEIPAWFNLSGREQSVHEDDKLLCAITRLSFLKDTHPHFTVDQARAVVQALFPTKARTIYQGSSSYGLKHLFEYVSRALTKNEGYKYCSNETLIAAFDLEDFKSKQDGPNRYFNISKKEIESAQRMFRN